MATVDKRYITALGPIKMEVMFLSSLATGDTVTSNLASPSNCVITTDNAASTTPPAAAVSGKTITVTQTSLSGAVGTLIVFGF
jgi:hypothetical protein